MRRMLLPCLGFALSLCVLPVHAGEQDAVRRAVASGQYKPLTEILAWVSAHYPGRVLDVELERDREGRAVYEIKLVDRDGRRHELHVDAVSGEAVDGEQALPDPRQIQPLATILRAVLARYPGQVLDVELERDEHGRHLYEIKVAQADGRQRELSVDAATGAWLDGDEQRDHTLQALKSLPDILDRVQARYPGVVVEAELERDRAGRFFYEIEIRQQDGQVLEVHVDAQDGRVLREAAAD